MTNYKWQSRTSITKETYFVTTSRNQTFRVSKQMGTDHYQVSMTEGFVTKTLAKRNYIGEAVEVAEELIKFTLKDGEIKFNRQILFKGV